MKIPQVSVFVSNRPGRLQAVCKSLADAGVNLLSLTLADSGEFGLIRLIVSDPEKAVDVLAKAGLSATITDVVACPVNAAIGGLAELLSTAVGSQQIDYMYAYPSTLNGSNIMILRFQDVDKAIEALKAGGSAPVVLNGANEAAVGAFLKGQIPFGRIPEIIREALDAIPVTPITCIADVYEADAASRSFARSKLGIRNED